MSKPRSRPGAWLPKVSESCNCQLVGRQLAGLQGEGPAAASLPLVATVFSWVSLSFPGARRVGGRSIYCHGNQRTGYSPH